MGEGLGGLAGFLRSAAFPVSAEAVDVRSGEKPFGVLREDGATVDDGGGLDGAVSERSVSQ